MMLKPATDKDLDKPRSLKVTIPTEFHLKLLALKVLEGKQLSETVTEALGEYFSKRELPPRTTFAP